MTCTSIFINLLACILCLLKSKIKLYFLRKYEIFYKRLNENIRVNESEEQEDSDMNENRSECCSRFLQIFNCKKHFKKIQVLKIQIIMIMIVRKHL